MAIARYVQVYSNIKNSNENLKHCVLNNANRVAVYATGWKIDKAFSTAVLPELHEVSKLTKQDSVCTTCTSPIHNLIVEIAPCSSKELYLLCLDVLVMTERMVVGKTALSFDAACQVLLTIAIIYYFFNSILMYTTVSNTYTTNTYITPKGNDIIQEQPHRK